MTVFKTMKHKLFIFTLLLYFSFNLTAQTPQLRVGLLNGPTCIPAANLMENVNSVSSGKESAKLTFEMFADPQALLPKMIKKEIDIGFMPVNVAAKIYNSGNKSLLLCAVTGLGNLKLITTDESVKHFSDLKGKTVYVAGQGATPEYMFRFLLEENNITYGNGGDVILDFSIPTAQIAAQLISGKIQYAQLKSAKVKAPLDLQNEYIEVTGEKDIYPLSVMVVRAEFAKANPELLKSFLAEFKKSVEWTISNPSEAGRLAEKNNLGLTAEVVKNAIPVSNYTYIDSEKYKRQIEAMLNIFLKCDKTSIGGKLPDKDFYYLNNE